MLKSGGCCSDISETVPQLSAELTIQRMKDALASGQVASVNDIVRIIEALARNENDLTVRDLADLIERDSVVLTRILSIANTMGYNPGSNRITTVSSAIHAVGFNRIRSLALSLMLMEQAGRRSGSDMQREMATLSLCSGLVAQAIAAESSLLDPDQAMVCGALRNFGRLLLSSYAPEETAAVQAAAAEAGAEAGDEAYARAFGITPLDLGFELLRAAHLPDVLLNAVRDLPPAALQRLDWAERQLIEVARFSLSFTELVLDDQLDAATFARRSELLAQSHAKLIPQLAERLPAILASVNRRLQKFAQESGGRSSRHLGLTCFKQRIAQRDLPRRTTLPPATPSSPSTAPHLRVPTPQATLAALAEVTDPATASALTRRAIEHCLNCEHFLHGVWDAAADDYRPLHGTSPLITHLEAQRWFRPGERDIVFLCRSRVENIIIRNAQDTAIHPYLPPWLRMPDAPQSLLLMPVHKGRESRGMILVGWNKPFSTSPSRELLGQIGLMLRHLA